MSLNLSEHPSDRVVERYAMNQLTGEENNSFEEHLLLCHTCQNRVTRSDEYLVAVRTAIRMIRKLGSCSPRSVPGSR
ncbi:MAG: hypothetical protein U0Q18_28950 [Bryobacteraceae bacterium]